MAKTWYPVIDAEKCINCLTCVDFCPHGVFEENEGTPVVVNPDNCVEFCRGCSKICPAEAIHYEGASAGEGK
ncbi:MAG: ATP-binding protein [Candidatus Fervidibacter sp.]|uniref:ATP-binding protein n=1 Tax=Candidatus Fervidibacter sp. TaxID=3100871 RepID=UPI0040499D69